MIYIATLQLLFSSVLWKKNKLICFLCLILSTFLSIQISTILFTGRAIPVLALTNLGDAKNIGYMPTIYFLIFFLTSLSITFLSFNKIKNKKIYWYLAFLLIASCFLKKSPARDFGRTLYLYYQEKRIANLPVEPLSSDHPLIKTKVVHNSTSERFLENNKYNVIVFFMEGTSDLILSEEVTPNIKKLSSMGISIKNYYSHTAATFRGLRGQLTSFYQMSSGYDGSNTGLGEISKEELQMRFNDSPLIPLPEILKENGYFTAFQAPNSKDHHLSIVLDRLGFDHIYGLEDSITPQSWSIERLTDKNTFSLVKKNIQEIQTPFFYGIYNFGTHLGMDSPDIKYGDGKNTYLNVFHSFDYHLGDFVDWFNKSPLSEDTILIITADHATYPTPEYRKTFNTFNSDFVDKIPFIIYKKGMKPAEINAKGMNSLSLAPTVLDILGIHHAKNMFLGSSIFDNKKPNLENFISAIGFDYFISDEEKHERIADKEITDRILSYQQIGQ